MNPCKLATICAILFPVLLMAQQDLTGYYAINKFGLASPGAMKSGLYGYDNPAMLTVQSGPDLFVSWSNKTGTLNNFDNWGLFAAVPNLGFAVVNSRLNGASLNNYKISGSLGDASFSCGLSYSWNTGDEGAFNASNLYTLGSLIRPNEYVSLGLIGNLLTSGRNEGIIDLAVRPLGDEYVSVFGDYSIKKDRFPGEIKWSMGAAIEALSGLRVTGRYFDTKFFSAGIELSFGNFGISSGMHYDDAGKNSFNSYGIRIGSYDRNIFHGLSSQNDYLKINLNGPLAYQRYKFLDNSNTLLNIIQSIRAAKNDKTIAGIAISTSGMTINKEKLWELREELKQFKDTGKHIVIYIDRPEIQAYDLASVADKIVLDPQGMIMLEGFIRGRQYYKNALEKLGIGFTEWRYFKYKSANETFSHDKMSEADSIQNQALVDDFYQTAKNDICEGRHIQPDKFDEMVNNHTLFLPDEALKLGLADVLGRWDDVNEIVKKSEGSSKDFIEVESLEEFKLPEDNYWGEKPKIAVIYAIGACAMDEGITARKLVNDVNHAVNNTDVKAIVLRVDSPGGDALASDIISEALKKCKGIKPVIISQGYVAASGGYWLSMYGDTIVAAPNTITGSIGVIGGWAYNKEFDSKLGVTTDYVKKGEHADIGFGFTFPFIGITLPDRDLTGPEQEKAELTIKTMYKDFVSRAASGRNKSFDYIDSIGQGRVWSGTAGLKNGLVDVLGGLSTAIDIAAKKAGLTGLKYDIIEYPEPGFIYISKLLPSSLGFEQKSGGMLDDLKFRIKNNGLPMPMLPAEDMQLLNEK
ncbi:MAG: S49 family peptidase [Ignavibacteriaceae bacterium]|nr:S49 family peptidase [Ignavibacteriaceae bacterium]